MELVAGLIIIALVVYAVIHGFRAASPTYIGDVGEARVSNRLKKLNADEYLVFNDIIVLDSEGVTTQIDHVVVSAYGVFVIETKCYKGWIFGEEKSRVWTQTLYGGSGWWSSSEKHTFQNPIRQNWRHIYVLSERLKILGMVNKYNRGIAKANKELEKNGNPRAQFDINKLTEFRVTIVSNEKSGTMKDKSGTMKDDAEIVKNSQVSVENPLISGGSGTMSGESGTMSGESGTMKDKSGTMNFGKAKLYDIESQDAAVFAVVAERPGIKKDQIFLRVQTSIRSVQRTLDRLVKANKIEYRGSKQKGGWFVKT